MKLFGISNIGITVIALLVAFLWGVIYAERTLTYQAERDYIELRRSLAPSPAQTQPARAPIAFPHSRPAEA